MSDNSEFRIQKPEFRIDDGVREASRTRGLGARFLHSSDSVEMTGGGGKG